MTKKDGVKIFISSSLKDEAYRTELEVHLLGLSRQVSIDIWHDRKIQIGDVWDKPIDRELENADIIIFLISPAFLSSEYDSSEEFKMAIQRQFEGNAIVIPIVIRSSHWSSTPFSKLGVLPRGGKPIANWESRDEAWFDVIRGIKSAIDIIAEKNEDTLLEESSDQPLPISEIFRTAGVPEKTYVVPQNYQMLKAHINDFKHGLAVEGPSGIGKTTIIKKTLIELHQNNVQWFRSTSEQDIEKLRVLLKKRLRGHIIIDDFHHLNPKLRQEIAKSIKELVESPNPKSAKISIIGINKVGHSLMEDFPELAGRVRVVSMGRQPDDLILKMIIKGERAANIKFRFRREIVEVARGSFFTAQLLCLHIAMFAKVIDSQSVLRLIEFRPSDVMKNVLKELEFKYHNSLHKFATLGNGLQSAGGTLILLWILRNEDSGYIRVDEAQAQYPTFKPAFNWMLNDNLVQAFERYPKLANLFFYDQKAKTLTVEDPQLIFYLKNIEWAEFCRKAGQTISISPEGKLKIKRKGNNGIADFFSLPNDSRVSSDVIWWGFALIVGTFISLISIIVIILPKEWWIGKLFILLAGAGTILVGLRNPKTKYIRAFWVVFAFFSSTHLLPALGLEASGSKFWVKIVTEGPNSTFNLVVGIVLIVLLLFDRLEHKKEN